MARSSTELPSQEARLAATLQTPQSPDFRAGEEVNIHTLASCVDHTLTANRAM
jgi:hypothetical protein